MKWISAKDRLPDKEGKYLIAYKIPNNYLINVANFAFNLKKVDYYDFKEEKLGFYKYDGEYGHYELDVDYWMPLPEPPKE